MRRCAVRLAISCLGGSCRLARSREPTNAARPSVHAGRNSFHFSNFSFFCFKFPNFLPIFWILHFLIHNSFATFTFLFNVHFQFQFQFKMSISFHFVHTFRIQILLFDYNSYSIPTNSGNVPGGCCRTAKAAAGAVHPRWLQPSRRWK